MKELIKGHRYLVKYYVSSSPTCWEIVEVTNTSYAYKLENVSNIQWIEKNYFNSNYGLIEDLGIPNPIKISTTPEEKKVNIQKVNEENYWDFIRKITEKAQEEKYQIIDEPWFIKITY